MHDWPYANENNPSRVSVVFLGKTLLSQSLSLPIFSNAKVASDTIFEKWLNLYHLFERDKYISRTSKCSMVKPSKHNDMKHRTSSTIIKRTSKVWKIQNNFYSAGFYDRKKFYCHSRAVSKYKPMSLYSWGLTFGRTFASKIVGRKGRGVGVVAYLRRAQYLNFVLFPLVIFQEYQHFVQCCWKLTFEQPGQKKSLESSKT